MDNKTDTVVWVHGDCLSPYNPALQKYANAPAIFVFDDGLIKEWGISFKRIVFMYECLMELPVVIRRGDVVDQLLNFANQHGTMHIATSESVSPRFDMICQKLDSQFDLEILKIEPFVEYDGDIDLKRFSRYWRKVQNYALTP